MYIILGRRFLSINYGSPSNTRTSFAKIFVSKSNCIYENLAFEEWLFRRHNIAHDGDVMLLWSNTPSVVIGRHQNPWLEANVRYCEKNKIKIARRHSGGGAVYHDLGNLNISILTSQKNHNRKQNLELITNQINNDLKLTCDIHLNQRDDLILGNPGDESKISGTAARISRGRAYHHFTLLVNVNINILREALHSPLKDKIETNATRSVPAHSVGYLAQKISSNIPEEHIFSEVQSCVIKAFKLQYIETSVLEWKGPNVRVSIDNAEDNYYPGLIANIRQLHSTEWIYGKTPKFYLRIYRTNSDDLYDILVENGKIKESIHKDFPIGLPFHYALLNTEFV